MRRFLYDTSVFSYALGEQHHYQRPCRRILERARARELWGEASVDLVQELAHQRFRKTGDREAAVEAATGVARLCALHELRPEDVLEGLELYRDHPSLSARDAVFAAVALGRGINAILATDRAFDDVPGLERIDPADEAAVDSLAA